MDAYELSAEQQGGTGSSGYNMRRQDFHLDTPFFKQFFECTIKITKQLQLKWLEKDKAYFFPTAIYDWYLTEPCSRRQRGLDLCLYTRIQRPLLLWQTVTPVRTSFILCGHYRTALNLLT